MKINIYRIEKFTVADKQIEVGDIIKIIPMEEYESMKVEFANKNLQKRIAGSFLRVVGIVGEDNRHDEDVIEYICKEVTGKIVGIHIVDSDIDYVLRGDNFLFRTADGKVHTAEPYGLNDNGFTNVTIDETTTIKVENEIDTTISKAEIKSKAQPLFEDKITHVQYGL